MHGQVGKRVGKFFPGHGDFVGTISYYAPRTETDMIVYEGAPPPQKSITNLYVHVHGAYRNMCTGTCAILFENQMEMKKCSRMMAWRK